MVGVIWDVQCSVTIDLEQLCIGLWTNPALLHSSCWQKVVFSSASQSTGEVQCLPNHSLSYRGLQEKQIGAIHTGSFLSAFARLRTFGREAVTPVGSNIQCGSWKLSPSGFWCPQ